jgi:hypothetical protein
MKSLWKILLTVLLLVIICVGVFLKHQEDENSRILLRHNLAKVISQYKAEEKNTIDI